MQTETSSCVAREWLLRLSSRLASEKQELVHQADFAKRAAEAASRIAALAECTDRRDAARKLAYVFTDMSGAEGAAVYVPASEGSSELVQSGMVAIR